MRRNGCEKRYVRRAYMKHQKVLLDCYRTVIDEMPPRYVNTAALLRVVVLVVVG